MLNDAEIEKASAQLRDYRRNDVLPKLLDDYETLIDDYKRLKSDYEEERDAREKYKQMARGQERNPFVLVLVDGDGYVFNDELVSKGADGGSHAAQLLHDTVKSSLRRKGLEHCQVMVRVYANISGLSKALSKAGLVGAEKRSLGPFVANFNRSYGLADFVDAGELKENADYKLRALLRLYADNAQCKHIYFAACHDVGYVSELTPHRGDSGRFTLVNSPGVRFHEEFTKLGMSVEELSGVFRSTPLDMPPPSSRLNGTPVLTKAAVVGTKALVSSPAKHAATQHGPSNDGQKNICQFYSMGKCRYGKTCKNLHVDEGPKASPSTPAAKTSPTFNPSHVANAATGFTSGNGSDQDRHMAGSWRHNAASTGSVSDVPANFTQLPKKGDVPRGCVAVNASGHRLDSYIPAPTAEAVVGLKARIGKRRLCNNMHLIGFCGNRHCEYDHSPLEDAFKPALESLARSIPCPKRGNCKNEACTWGHICQRPDCKFRGGKVVCKMSYLSHMEDLSVADYVPATKKQSRNREGSVANSAGSSPDEDDVKIITSSTVAGEEDEEDEDLTSHVGGDSGALIDFTFDFQ